MLHSGEEVACDVVKLKVCYCIQRDSKKALKRPLSNLSEDVPVVEPKRGHILAHEEGEGVLDLSKVNPHLIFTDGCVPDEDGNYSFVVRVHIK